MEYREFKAKTVDEAITLASTEFGCATCDNGEKGGAVRGVGRKQAMKRRKKKIS